MKSTSFREFGSVGIFFASVMVPLLLLLFSLSVDISRYYRESGTAQRVLDEVAMHAARFLPFQEEAAATARLMLARHGDFFEGVTMEVTSDAVSFALHKPVPLTFAKFFWHGAEIPISVVSSARTTPYDAYIALDTSRYLAPRFGDPVWDEDNQLDWPAAHFFTHEREIRHQGEPIDARWLTQQCFNSAFSSLKVAGIRIYEYLAGFRHNSLGVGFFPGMDGQIVQEARPLTPAFNRMVAGGDAVFPVYNRLFGSSEYCASAAEVETQNVQYRVPASNEQIASRFIPSPGAPSIINPHTWSYNAPDYDQFLQMKEVIWSRVAHEVTPRTEDIIAAITGALMNARFDGRGGLMNSSVRLAIILAGDVPWTSDVTSSGSVYYRFGEDQIVEERLVNVFRNLAAQLSKRENSNVNIKLLYIVLSHPALPEVTKGSQINKLKDFFSKMERVEESPVGVKHSNLSLKVISASNPEMLLKEVAATVVMSDRGSMVSR